MDNFKIKGIVYSKPIDVRKGKKDPTKSYEFRSIVIETKVTNEFIKVIDDKQIKQRVTKPKLLKFDLSDGMNIDEFEVRDPIEISFFLDGNEYTDVNGMNQIITKPKASFIKFIDIEGVPKRERTKEDITFAPPSQVSDDDNTDDAPLPF
jgi:hypothetical protein